MKNGHPVAPNPAFAVTQDKHSWDVNKVSSYFLFGGSCAGLTVEDCAEPASPRKAEHKDPRKMPAAYLKTWRHKELTPPESHQPGQTAAEPVVEPTTAHQMVERSWSSEDFAWLFAGHFESTEHTSRTGSKTHSSAHQNKLLSNRLPGLVVPSLDPGAGSSNYVESLLLTHLIWGEECANFRLRGCVVGPFELAVPSFLDFDTFVMGGPGKSIAEFAMNTWITTRCF